MKTITINQELIQQKAVENQKLYLSDIFKNDFDLFPKNAVFNKSVTGIGGTHLVLSANVSSIILMPFQAVVKNKVSNFPNIFSVLEGVSVEMIVNYLNKNKIRKIVSTYDGLSKLIKAYEIVGIDIYSEFLLVDEWQVLYSQYLLRDVAFSFLIKETPKFKQITYMTATPIEKKYWFKEMKHLEEVVLEYDIEQPVVKHFKVNSIESEAVSICKQYLNKSENAHIFCNSVKFIKEVCKLANLSTNDVKIVCANSKSNQIKLGDYIIANTLDKVKKINFYTSTCFEGADLFDENGNLFVFADGTKSHTLIDISTQLPQIAGRIRDIKDTTINFIYKTIRHSPGVTFEEFEAACAKQKEKAIRLEKLINQSNEEIQELLKEVVDVLNSKYLRVKENKLQFDEMLMIIDELTFKIKNVYKTKANVIAKIETSKFIPISIQRKQAELLKVENSHRTSFKEKIKNYHNLVSNCYHFDSNIDQFIVNAYNKLGFDKITKLDFSISKVKAELLKVQSPDTTTLNIFKCMNYKTGEFYSNKLIKKQIQAIYNNLGLKKTAKASNITDFYDVKPSKQNTENGVIIIRSKVQFIK